MKITPRQLAITNVLRIAIPDKSMTAICACPVLLNQLHVPVNLGGFYIYIGRETYVQGNRCARFLHLSHNVHGLPRHFASE